MRPGWPAGFAGAGATVAAVLTDLNNDRAVDLIVTGAETAPMVYLNQREGPFKAAPLYSDAGLSPAVGVYVFDFNKDGWMDVALTHSGAPGVSLWRNVDGTHFERVPLPIPAGATSSAPPPRPPVLLRFSRPCTVLPRNA